MPALAESRDNFRIPARRVYEIRNGELGRLYRDGGIMADSRDYLMNVDAVGSDFRLYPIPNCGKGQPMQIKKLGNGGPTMRSRDRKSTRLNSSHLVISYAVFCLKKKKKPEENPYIAETVNTPSSQRESHR